MPCKPKATSKKKAATKATKSAADKKKPFPFTKKK